MNMALPHGAGIQGRKPRLASLKGKDTQISPATPSADMRGVMRLIEDRLDDVLQAVPARCRHHFAEALLRIAMEHIGR